MRIAFTVDGATAEFRRNALTGRAELIVDGKMEVLQDPLAMGTHVQFSLTRTWKRSHKGHEVVIEKTRTIVFGGFRPQRYRILVDGSVVAEQHGY